MIMQMTRQIAVQAVHQAPNRNILGPANAPVHGHDLQIQVTIQGPFVDRFFGIIPRGRFEEFLEREVRRPLDGVNLNDVLADTPCEALAAALMQRLVPLFATEFTATHPDLHLVQVGIVEGATATFAP